MSVVTLAAALSAAGLEYGIEAVQGLAILRPRTGVPTDASSLRAIAPQLAREHGFTHVALELVGDASGAGAAVSRA